MMCASLNSNMTGVTSGAGTANLPEHLSSTPGFSGVRVAQYLVFCVVFCRSLLVLFLLALVLSVLYFTASDYNFGIFKLFFENIKLNSTVQLFSILIPHCRKSMKNFIT